MQAYRKRVPEKQKTDIWLAPQTETHDYEAKLARSAKGGVKTWIDSQNEAVNSISRRAWQLARRFRGVAFERTDPVIEGQLSAGIELGLPGLSALVAFQEHFIPADEAYAQFRELRGSQVPHIFLIYHRAIDASHR